MEEIRERLVVSFDPSYDGLFQYNAKDIDYTTQYNNLYNSRIQRMKELIMGNIEHLWLKKNPELTVVSRIIDVEATLSKDSHTDCVIVGVVYKHMPLRSSVINEIKDGYSLSGPSKFVENYTSKKDQVYIEDESGRMLLTGNDSIQLILPTLVTGVMIAVRGKVDIEHAIFYGEEYVFAGPSLTPEVPALEDRMDIDGAHDDPYVLFVSGLEIGDSQDALVPSLSMTSDSHNKENLDEEGDYQLACQLLVDFIAGRVGGEQDIEIARKISRVIVAGNSIANADARVSRDRYTQNSNGKNLESIKNVKQVDLLLSQILSSCPVDLLPGPTDPTSIVLPQQPYRSYLLPTSTRFSSLYMATNPHHCVLDSQYILLGHSGQAIHDIALQSSNPVSNKEPIDVEDDIDEKFPLDILKRTFQWGHMFPTCPDTLPTYPFKSHDPFIIDQDKLPTIFYAGNQVDFDSEIMSYSKADGSTHKVLILTIPSFKRSREAILVNLRSLQTQLISFQNLASIRSDDSKSRHKGLKIKKKSEDEDAKYAIAYDDDIELDI